MRSILKVVCLVALPFLIGSGLFALQVIAAKAGLFAGVYSHDIFESHQLSGLYPLFACISFFLGFIPAGILSSNLYAPAAIPADAQMEEEAQERSEESATALFIGKIITSAGANCNLRVKALKVRAILEHHNELLADYL